MGGAALGLDRRRLWSTALPLSLLAGLVLLGGAPFHFWAADVFQGARPWLAPLAVAALQVAGAAWLARRLDGIELRCPEARAAERLLAVAAGIAFAGGRSDAGASSAGPSGASARSRAFTARSRWLLRHTQRTAAHALARALGRRISRSRSPARRWCALPAGGRRSHRPRGCAVPRHPLTGIVGLIGLFSLAGVPGTPGARLWLDAARSLAATRHFGLLALLGLAWVVAFSSAMRQWHEAVGVPGEPQPAGGKVPWPARTALWIAGPGVLALGFAWWLGRG